MASRIALTTSPTFSFPCSTPHSRTLADHPEPVITPLVQCYHAMSRRALPQSTGPRHLVRRARRTNSSPSQRITRIPLAEVLEGRITRPSPTPLFLAHPLDVHAPPALSTQPTSRCSNWVVHPRVAWLLRCFLPSVDPHPLLPQRSRAPSPRPRRRSPSHHGAVDENRKVEAVSSALRHANASASLAAARIPLRMSFRFLVPWPSPAGAGRLNPSPRRLLV